MKGAISRLAIPGLFALAAPTPRAAVVVLTQQTRPGDPTPALLAAVALVGWLLLAWLSAVTLLLVAGRLPGALGVALGATGAALAPAVVRRSLAVALGLGLASSAASASWAAGPASSGPNLDWPVAATASPAPDPARAPLDWPTAASASASASGHSTPTPAAPESLPTHRAPQRTTYVVRPGDSLWRIAAGQLAGPATPERIAATWPSWWAANRDQIGADPDLLLPGTRLTPPRPTLNKE